jgi:hypothetical protein
MIPFGGGAAANAWGKKFGREEELGIQKVR